MNFTPEQVQEWKPKFNKAVIIMFRRIITILANILPILYSPTRNQEIIAEQNAKIGDTDYSDTFDSLDSAFEYINPILFSIFKTQDLREAIAKYAPQTYSSPSHRSTTTILLLQDDRIPRLIAFGCQENLNYVFDTLNIDHQDKNVDVIPFEYFSLQYVVILKPKNYREVYIKFEDLLVDNQPHLYRMIMDFIKVTVRILEYSESTFVNPQLVATGSHPSYPHASNSVQQDNINPQPSSSDPEPNSQGESSSNQAHTVTTVYMTYEERSTTVNSHRDAVDMMRNAGQQRRYYM